MRVEYHYPKNICIGLNYGSVYGKYYSYYGYENPYIALLEDPDE